MAIQTVFLIFSGLCAQFSTGYAATTLPEYPSQALPLAGILNNKAATSAEGHGPVANFDGAGGAYDSQFLPTGSWEYDGLTFALPSSWDGSNDNVLANGQVLRLQKPTFVHELHFLYAGDGTSSPVLSVFTLNFADNTSQPVNLYAKNWWVWANVNRAAIITPYHFEKTQKNLNATNIFEWSTSVPSESPLESITFPPTATSNRMHVFGLSITPSTTDTTSGPALAVRRARFTTRWEDIDGVRAQAVEVTLANLLPGFTLSRNTSLTTPHTIELVGAGMQTVSTGVINRLVPGDQARVDVFVTGSTANGSARVQIRDSSGNVVAMSAEFPTSPLVENYTPDQDSLSMHETPSWWNAAKYGIFIHWGVYSTPAFAPPSQYAEWYDWDIRQPPDSSNPTWEHHLQTYGKDVIYDDFIPDFTAAKFNASAWVDLFDRAGAKYFVLVTKHHDGFALFDTGTH
jgi:alpha-L-fucosidase